MEFPLIIKMQKKDIFAFKLSDVVIIVLMNIKMPTIADILTFMSMITFMPI